MTAGHRGATGGRDDRGLFLNVLPPGQGSSFTARGGPTPPHTEDQVDMYASLAGTGPLSDRDLLRYFKPERLGLAPGEVVREEHPSPGVTILRDRFGVPHVYG